MYSHIGIFIFSFIIRGMILVLLARLRMYHNIIVISIDTRIFTKLCIDLK